MFSKVAARKWDALGPKTLCVAKLNVLLLEFEEEAGVWITMRIDAWMKIRLQQDHAKARRHIWF